MSIVRLSCVRDTLYAPGSNGEYVSDGYNARKRPPVGRLEKVSAPRLLPGNSQLGRYLDYSLGEASASLGAGQPVVVLVHGFLFDPKHAPTTDPAGSDNPHSRLYGFVVRDEFEEWRDHASSWPVHLGFEDDQGETGIAIAFGWHSQPGFASSLIKAGRNFYSRAYQYAGESSWPLLNTLCLLSEHDAIGDRPIDLFVHSLGTRVVLRALAKAAKIAGGREPDAPAVSRDRLRNMFRHLDRIILIGGSEYVVEAQIFYDRLLHLATTDNWTIGDEPPIGPTVYNIGSRENDVLDLLGENFGPRTFGNTQVIGHNGLGRDTRAGTGAQRWMDLQIDKGKLRDWLKKERISENGDAGFDISGDRAGTIWDHWYYYTYRGNMAFYRSLLRERERWGLKRMRDGSHWSDGDPVPEDFDIPWYRFGD